MTTIIFIILIIWTIILWIESLSSLGRVHENILNIENVTKLALDKIVKQPSYGCNNQIFENDPNDKFAHTQVGYILSINYSLINNDCPKE